MFRKAAFSPIARMFRLGFLLVALAAVASASRNGNFGALFSESVANVLGFFQPCQMFSEREELLAAQQQQQGSSRISVPSEHPPTSTSVDV